MASAFAYTSRHVVQGQVQASIVDYSELAAGYEVRILNSCVFHGVCGVAEPPCLLFTAQLFLQKERGGRSLQSLRRSEGCLFASKSLYKVWTSEVTYGLHDGTPNFVDVLRQSSLIAQACFAWSWLSGISIVRMLWRDVKPVCGRSK